MTNDEYTARALDLGRLAFAAGLPCVPAMDGLLMSLIALNRDKPMGSAIAPLKAWHTGWAEANVSAFITEEE